jgi:hypothetical protein
MKMATDKGSMKIRLKQIGDLVAGLVYERKANLPDFERGYLAGKEDLALQIRQILNSPVKGHTTTPNSKRKQKFLEKREKEALNEWDSMTDQQRQRYEFREFTYADSESRLDAFFDLVDALSEFGPTSSATVTFLNDQPGHVVEVKTDGYITFLEPGQSLGVYDNRVWVVK